MDREAFREAEVRTRQRRKTRRTGGNPLLLALLLSLPAAGFGQVEWVRKSSTTGDVPIPNEGAQQTCCVVCDIDKDGIEDFVVGERTRTPSVVWFKFNGKTWDRFVIDNERLNPEAGGDSGDVDGDGDLDIILGQDASGNRMWWWENPYPKFDQPWERREIKNSGPSKHHDQTVGDYDGDGKAELVSWNQRAKKLLLFEIPENPKTDNPWPSTAIYSWESGQELEGFPSVPVDVDLDGQIDLVGGGRWFKHKGGTEFEAHVIDDTKRFTQCAAGQLVKGGRPEIVFSPGDMDGEAKWYEWDGKAWKAHTLRHVIHGHTCEIRDVDGDGNLDVFIGEMGKPGAGDNAKTYIWYGDGKGGFKETVASTGQGIHEGKLGDLDGDGDLDILMKPYNHNSPRIDILLNNGTGKEPAGSAAGPKASLDRWQRYRIDDLPQRSMFVAAADLDGDGRKDLVAGGWWWKSPGALSGKWQRHTIGEPLRNMAIVYDFDGDGDTDILGTEGAGSAKNNDFVWARNEGKGKFKILDNIETGGDGDFLQGCILIDFGTVKQVVLSWHNGGGGIQALTIPRKTSYAQWRFGTLSETTEKEDLCASDIDRDGDPDILIGTQWLRNDIKKAVEIGVNPRWTPVTLGSIDEGEADRVDLADVNGDGRLDAVIGLELGYDIYWFEAPPDPNKKWRRHKIGVIAGQGFSMDTADFDGDGDPDVVFGEHRGKGVNRVIIFENKGKGGIWKEHIVDTGSTKEIDHHDGTQAVDLDGDGDLDIISIGWYNPKLWVFENK